MSGGIGPGGQGYQQAATQNVMQRLGLRPNNSVGVLANNFTNWGTGAGGISDLVNRTPNPVLPTNTNPAGEHSGSRIGDLLGANPGYQPPAPPVDNSNDIYKQLMALAAQSSAGGKHTYDIKGALKDIAGVYAPNLKNLDQIGAHKTARELANEKSLNAVYKNLADSLGGVGNQSRASYDQTMGADAAANKTSSDAIKQQAAERIQQMTADYNRLGQTQQIAGDTQKILNQRDQALERIAAQDQTLHGGLQQLQGANSNWFQQAQGTSKFQGANAIRDQKALLTDALDQLDTQRAGILSNRAQAQMAAQNQYRTQVTAPTGPNVSQMLQILAAQDAHGKALDAHAAAGQTTDKTSSALDTLIQKGGLNGANAYIKANNLGTNFTNGIRDFITSTPTQDQYGKNMTSQALIQKALQYATNHNLDPSTFQNLAMVYLKL